MQQINYLNIDIYSAAFVAALPFYTSFNTNNAQRVLYAKKLPEKQGAYDQISVTNGVMSIISIHTGQMNFIITL
jgi:hypothetical protein